MSTVDVIVFDVGRVLVDFSLEHFGSFLQSKGASLKDIPDFIAKTGMHDYECGKMSSEEFLNRLSALLPEPVVKEELVTEWKQIFHPVDEMLDLLDRVSKNYPVYLLSNSNKMHWEFLEEEYRLSERVNGITVSFQAGAMKPSAIIYEAVEKNFSLEPTTIVLIDDIKEHVAAAQDRGWHGIQHLSHQKTVAELIELGVTVS